MKKAAVQLRLHAVLVLLTCMSGMCFSLAAQEAPPESVVEETQPETEESAGVEEKRELARKAISDKSTWEHIVDFPGELLIFPLHMFLHLSEHAVVYVADTKLIPKTIDFLTADDGSFGLRPTYNSRSGIGLKFFHKDVLTPGSRFTLEAASGFDARQRYAMRLRRVSLGSSPLFAGMGLRYQKLTAERYFHNNLFEPDSNQTTFGLNQYEAQITLGAAITPRLDFDAEFALERTEAIAGTATGLRSTTDFYSEAELPGITEGAGFLRLQAGVTYDGKPHPGNPWSGQDIRIQAALYNELREQDFGFWKVNFDFSQYINLFWKRVLVLRLAAEFTEALDNRSIPFYYLAEIGRQETVRGFKRGRFRDNDALIGSLEYRYPIWRPLSAYFFVDAGKVSPDLLDELNTDDLETTWGAGLRLFNKGGLVAKTEFGISEDGPRYYLSLNQGL